MVLFPIYSLFNRNIGFSIFYKQGSEWMLSTRGVTVPVNSFSLSAIEYFRHFVPDRGGVVFDVGGELGLEARQFSGIVGDEGKVYTFECLPTHLESLNEIAKERLNLEVINKACWNKKDTLTFFEGNTPGSGTAVPDAKGQRGQDLANTEGREIKVEADTLDCLWQLHADGCQIDFLKMDIEGAEYEALEGATGLLEKTNKVVIAAYHLREGVRTADKVAVMLKESGFEVRIDENDHVYGWRKN